MLLVWCEGETITTSLGLVFQNKTAITSPFWVYKLPLRDKKIIVQ
jgi:hypothetical protein